LLRLQVIISAVLFLIVPSASASTANGILKRRGHAGFRVTSSEAGNQHGMVIREVEPNGLATTLGLRTRDIITAIDSEAVPSKAQFENLLRRFRAGDQVRFTVERDNRRIDIAGEMPEEPRETIRCVDVVYDSVLDRDNRRLRTIITHPSASKERLPVIFVAGWLSSDSIEAPNGSRDATALVFRTLAQLPGFATMRLDKEGVGDSEGDCAETDFQTELSGYRAAFASLARYDFVDANRVYMLGISNGGGFSPLIPANETQRESIRGYGVVGGWVKTWFEHMIEEERKRLRLEGKSPEAINDAMKQVEMFYHDYLIEHKLPGDILKQRPELASIWSDDSTHQYGRPARFYHQLQDLNLAAAWSRVTVPTLALRGQFDPIMSREDHEMIVAMVNGNKPGAARFVELPNTGHAFDHYATAEAAARGDALPFDPSGVEMVAKWLQEQAKK
jgi:pimeloyl-ACP methyl ester carboxylesterase